MKRLLIGGVCVGLLAGALGCSEPDKRVVAASADGAFEVALSAKKNWLRPGDALPIRVEVVSLAGRLAATRRETMTFVVNNGSVTPSYLPITFVGRDDSVTAGAEDTYRGWITFTSSYSAAATDQGEVHALFGDIQATLKIRITE